VPCPHGQFAKCFSGKRIGRNDEWRSARTAMRHDRYQEELVRPLRATGDAAPQKEAARTAVGRNAIRFETKRHGLPPLAGDCRERQYAEGRRSQRGGLRITASMHNDAVNRQRGDQRKCKRGRTHGD
jgi:hypothetical protein